MSGYQTLINKIKVVLKDDPRGLTIGEISEKIKINRNSVSKYLEIMLVSGEVDMKSIGRAKVYYLSQRVPLSAMLNFLNDIVLVLNSDLKIVQVNQAFLEHAHLNREDIIGYDFEDSPFFISNDPKMIMYIKKGLDGEAASFEMKYNLKNTEMYFGLKVIPSVFIDGEKGVTIIFKDISRRKRYETVLLELHGHAKELGSCLFLDDVFQITLGAMVKTLGFDRVDILMVEGDQLVQVIAHKSLPTGLVLPLDGKGITVKAIREKRSIIVNDVSLNDDYLYATAEITKKPIKESAKSRSELVTPLIIDGEAIGVLNVESELINPFTKTDQQLLELLAGHVESAILRLTRTHT